MAEPSESRVSGPEHDEPREISTKASVLLAMLVIFGLAVAVTLSAVVGPPPLSPVAQAVSTAYGPSDFPDIFEQNPIAGLDPEVEGRFQVPPPPIREPDIFPCSDCHEGDPGDPTRRALAFHESIVLEHDTEHRWCLDCHLDVNRDVLHLADRTPVPFGESYRLCGQCHGHEFADWRAGAHGRRVGFWDGPKRYLLCVHCHDPHTPTFRPIAPLPPPVPPEAAGSSTRPRSSPRGEQHETP